MEALASEWLLAIGIVLIGLEALSLIFFLFPVGLGFVIVGILGYLGLEYELFFPQLATVLLIALIFILFFRKKFILIISKSSSNKEIQVHKGGVGIVAKNQIKFSGTYWNTDDDLSLYNDGDRVEVKIIKNRAIISKKLDAS